MAENNTSWESVADWYGDYLEHDTDSYHAAVVLPNLMRLMAVEKEDVVLDLACGSGFFTKEFCAAGSTVVGIDLSAQLLERAKKVAPKATFFEASADSIPMIGSESVSKIAIVLALQNIENIKKTFSECSRVLQSEGSLFVVLNHPTFRIPKRSSWEWDSEKEAQYRRIDAYMSEAKHEIIMHPGKQNSAKTLSFHRPLQVYMKAAQAASFGLVRLEEWISHKYSAKGARQKEEDRIRKEIPLFMALEFKKL